MKVCEDLVTVTAGMSTVRLIIALDIGLACLGDAGWYAVRFSATQIRVRTERARAYL